MKKEFFGDTFLHCRDVHNGIDGKSCYKVELNSANNQLYITCENQTIPDKEKYILDVTGAN